MTLGSHCRMGSAALRLVTLRDVLKRLGVDGLIVPRADEHLGEYVPPGAERLAWLTGFTGSAGLAIVLADQAAVFPCGRYVWHWAAKPCAAFCEPLHITGDPPPAWLVQHTQPGARIGYDPLLISEDGVVRYRDAGLPIAPVAENL